MRLSYATIIFGLAVVGALAANDVETVADYDAVAPDASKHPLFTEAVSELEASSPITPAGRERLSRVLPAPWGSQARAAEAVLDHIAPKVDDTTKVQNNNHPAFSSLVQRVTKNWRDSRASAFAAKIQSVATSDTVKDAIRILPHSVLSKANLVHELLKPSTATNDEIVLEEAQPHFATKVAELVKAKQDAIVKKKVLEKKKEAEQEHHYASKVAQAVEKALRSKSAQQRRDNEKKMAATKKLIDNMANEVAKNAATSTWAGIVKAKQDAKLEAGVLEKKKEAEQAQEAKVAEQAKRAEIQTTTAEKKKQTEEVKAASENKRAELKTEREKLKLQAAQQEAKTALIHRNERADMQKQVTKEEKKGAQKLAVKRDEYAKEKKHSQALEKQAEDSAQAVTGWHKKATAQAKANAQQLKKSLAHQRDHITAPADGIAPSHHTMDADEVAVETELDTLLARGDEATTRSDVDTIIATADRVIHPKKANVATLINEANRVMHPKQARSVDRYLEKASSDLEAVQLPSSSEEDDVDIDLLASQEKSGAIDHDRDADMERMLPTPSEIAATPGVLIAKDSNGHVDVQRLHAKMVDMLALDQLDANEEH